MPRIRQCVLAAIAIQCCAFGAAQLTVASPSVQVSYIVESGLAIWEVSVTPDPQLLAEGQAITYLQLSVETNHPTSGPRRDEKWDQPFSGNVIPGPLLNPYTGAEFHGADCYCSIPSLLGLEGSVNALYASLESVDLTSPEPTKAFNFWVYEVNSAPTILKYFGTVAQGIEEDPVHFSGEFAFHASHKLRDANVDGTINNLDIDHMLIALTDSAAWEALHPGENILEYMDANFDGAVNNLDISNLITIVDYPPPNCPWPSASPLKSQVPEPCAIVLAAALGVLTVLRRWRSILSSL